MFADDFGRQITLEAFDERQAGELRQIASHERNERAEYLVKAHLELSDVERRVLGEELISTQEWFKLSPDEQADRLPLRWEVVKNGIDDMKDNLVRQEDLDEIIEDRIVVDGSDAATFGHDLGHLETEQRVGYD